jgi:glutathione-independent formaldehyde dehydrogenase
MSGNRGVVYLGNGKVEVQKIDYPKMQDPRGRKIDCPDRPGTGA